MIAYAGISKIELYKVIMTVPAFIPKIVSAGTFSVEIQILEPSAVL